MRRSWVPLAVAAVALLAVLTAGRADATVAQEGTPPPGEEGVPEGLTFEPLAFGLAEELPAAPAGLLLARFTLDPGAGFPFEEDDPAVGLLYVESGTLTVRVEAPFAVLRGAAVATAVAGGFEEEPALEEVAAGTEVTLEAGDSMLIAANVAGEVRNDGDVPAVALAALVEPEPAEDAATPAG